MLKTTIPLVSFHRMALSAMLAFAVFGCVGEVLAQDPVTHVNGVTVLTVQNPQAAVDFVNAKAMPLPINDSPQDPTQSMIQALLASPDLGPSGGEPGARGTGILSPVFQGTAVAEEPGVTSEDWGTTNHPFTTVRADLFGLDTNTAYPYRAAGDLYFSEPAGTYICSGSLIKPGIVVTAAHCVANYGKKEFYSNWHFRPAYRDGAAPFGVWTAKAAIVLTSYYAGTDGCAQYGVICPDDVALLVLTGDPGHSTGWFGYWYGGGYSGTGLFQITQLGYPAGLDDALYMERTDSYGYTNASLSHNTIIGTNMNGGSSGGPWIENFGLPSALTGETNGSFPEQNVVVGVTSWGYTSTGPKEAGAAPFTSGNIGTLVTTVCRAYPANCE